MAESSVKFVKLKSDQRSMQNERIVWDSLLSASEEEKVADLSQGEMGKSRISPCRRERDTGKSPTLRTSACLLVGCHRLVADVTGKLAQWNLEDYMGWF